MCRQNSLIKIGVVVLISAILGLIAGIVWPMFFAFANRYLLAILATSTIALIILTLYLLFGRIGGCKDNYELKANLTLLLYSALGAFVTSILSLTTTLTASISSSVLFGVTTGFFALLLLSITLTLNYLLNK